MYYTKEQIEELKNLDVIRHFNTVLDSEYKRGTFRETDERVADIYESATNTKVSRNFTCKSCVFNLYKNAGLLYRKSLDYFNKERMRKAREAKENKNKEKIIEDTLNEQQEG